MYLEDAADILITDDGRSPHLVSSGSVELIQGNSYCVTRIWIFVSYVYVFNLDLGNVIVLNPRRVRQTSVKFLSLFVAENLPELSKIHVSNRFINRDLQYR